MACSNCNSNPCDCQSLPTSCIDAYKNCGCLNPTTFGCTTYEGSALSCLDIANGENGNDILTKIESKICDIGKVKLDGSDNCPEFLSDKISSGTNINITYTGTGCDKTMVINATVGGVPVDVKTKVTSNDTTNGYLNEKLIGGTYITKGTINPSGNEQLKLDVVPATLISGDAGNQLTLGTDGGLKTIYIAPDGSETKIIQGLGVIISGTGTLIDPYIISTNPSIQITRPCFDNIWRNIPISSTGNPNVVFTSGAPQYRYRFDGTIEFRGSISYTVSFGNYQSGNRRFIIPLGTLSTSCLSALEQIGVSDLKNINYIDIPQASADQITQMYGYIIRKSAQNIIVEFQSSFTNATSKVIIINFEGAVSYPNI